MIRDYYWFDGIFVGDTANDMIFGFNRNSDLTSYYPSHSYIYGGDGFDLIIGDHVPVFMAQDAGSTPFEALDINHPQYWSNGENPDIDNATGVPHTTVAGHGNGEVLIYEVFLEAGAQLTVDIDWAFGTVGGGSFDSMIEIRSIGGNVLASNDDANISDGANGSIANLDSYLTFHAPARGSYYIAVGQSSSSGLVAIDETKSFVMNVSANFHQYSTQPAGNDSLLGEGGDDVLYGMGGDDWLYGETGNNILDGGSGSDTASYFYATSGVEVDLAITAAQNTGTGSGTDTLRNVENLTGSAYNDTLYGDDTDNRLDGGRGYNELYGRDGNDTLLTTHDLGLVAGLFDGGSGIDTLQIYLSPGTAVYNVTPAQLISIETLKLSGFYGNIAEVHFLEDAFKFLTVERTDLSSSSVAEIHVYGQSLNDDVIDLSGITFLDFTENDRVIIHGTEYGNQITGTSVNDLILSGGSNNVIDGGDGDDWIGFNTFDYGSPGHVHNSNIWSGGEGSDTLVYEQLSDANLVDLQAGTMVSFMGDLRASLTSFENISAGSGVDLLSGTDGDNTIWGNGGNDFINGLAGTDKLYGGAGDDTFRHDTEDGAALSTYDGGADNDTLTIFGATEEIDFADATIVDIETLRFESGGSPAFTAVFSGDQFNFDTVRKGTSIVLNLEIKIGSSPLDLSSLSFSGVGAGDEIAITGTGAADSVIGSSLGDIISLGAGNDILRGGPGADTLTGGTGSDSFMMYAGEMDGDVIMDFSAEDLISSDVSQFIRKAEFSATGASEIRYYRSGDNTVFEADMNGDGSADESFSVLGIMDFRGPASNITRLEEGRRDFGDDGTADLMLVLASGAYLRLDSPALAGTGSAEARTGFTSIGMADLDGDGVLDNVVRAPNDNYAIQFSGSNSGSTTIGGRAFDIVGFADFDGDGADEALTTSTNPQNGRFYIANNGLTERDLIGFNGRDVLGFGDFDGDGADDILFENVSGGMRIFEADHGPMNVGRRLLDAKAIGDFNGDGLDDVLTTNPNKNGHYYLLEGDAANPLGDATFIGYQSLELVAAGDFDGDGTLDILGNQNGTSFQMLTNGLTTLTAINFGNDTFEAIGDFNGDGEDDILLSRPNEQGRIVYSGDRNDTALIDALIGKSVRDVADYDGDGSDDLLVQDDTDGSYSILLSGVGSEIELDASLDDADVIDPNGLDMLGLV